MPAFRGDYQGDFWFYQSSDKGEFLVEETEKEKKERKMFQLVKTARVETVTIISLNKML